MLPVETELHLALKVRASGVEVNDLATWVAGQKHDWAREILGDVLWQMQEQALARVFDGADELVCRGCGVVCSGAGAVLRRGTRPRQVHTSSGVVEFALRQVTCWACRVTWCPFLEQRLLSGVVEQARPDLARGANRAAWSPGGRADTPLQPQVRVVPAMGTASAPFIVSIRPSSKR